MNDRYGRFSIPTELFKRAPSDVMQIFGKCIVIRAESSYMRHAIDYEAMSPHFDIVAEGEITPEYEWVFSSGGKWEARRLDRYTTDQVKAMIDKAVRSVPKQVIIKERRRGWR